MTTLDWQGFECSCCTSPHSHSIRRMIVNGTLTLPICSCIISVMYDTDTTLLTLIEQRDVHALSELYDRYSHMLFALACVHTRSTDHAEQLVAHAFSEIWQAPAKVHGRQLKHALIRCIISSVNVAPELVYQAEKSVMLDTCYVE
jgi:hypothetical protein